MKRLTIAFLFAAVCCLFSATPGIAGAGAAKFGTGVTKDWKLVNEGTEFNTNLISCAFFCNEPIGAMNAVISIYHTENDRTQSVLARITIDVNPKWGILVLPDIPLPTTGLFTFTLSRTDGNVLATGDVLIREKKVEEKMPEQPKVDGTTVEGLFNKFKPQK